MSKSKHAKPDEFQKEQIRHLKKELKRANQTIRTLEKDLGYNQNRSINKIDKEIEELPDCPSCGKGFLKEIILLGRSIKSCGYCDYRTKARKI